MERYWVFWTSEECRPRILTQKLKIFTTFSSYCVVSADVEKTKNVIHDEIWTTKKKQVSSEHDLTIFKL